MTCFAIFDIFRSHIFWFYSYYIQSAIRGDDFILNVLHDLSLIVEGILGARALLSIKQTFAAISLALRFTGICVDPCLCSASI